MPDYFYTALINVDGRIEFAEHYADKKTRDDRAKTLELEAAIRGEADGKWLAWAGDEPYEGSNSVLTDPPIDDRPEWYKLGFQSQAEYEKAKKVVDFAKKKMNEDDEDA